MLDSVEGFRDVDGDGGCAERRFWSVEARRDSRHGRKESSRGGVARTEAVLGRRDGERRRKKRKKTAFKKLRGRAKKRNRTIGS